MARPYNFGAGPAMLPTSILEEVQAELLDWQSTGMSVMEIGHRTTEFNDLMLEAEASLRRLLSIPSDYVVLFLGGAARTQFSMIPLNLLQAKEKAGYLLTGIWSSIAFEEARKLKNAYIVCSAQSNNYTSIPDRATWELQEDTKYFYFTPNETINGIRFPYIPKLKAPLIADMTSCLLSEPINITDYGLIFAGAQKNIANAGLTIVIMQKKLIDAISDTKLPTMLDYRIMSEHHSLYATPPTFNCYLALKMFKWLEKQGGVQTLYDINKQKAANLYNYIDNSDFYQTDVKVPFRSLMNVCFDLKNTKLLDLFLNEAKKRNLLCLSGHRTVGGLRASIYNPMPLQGVDELIDFMTDFAKEHSNEKT